MDNRELMNIFAPDAIRVSQIDDLKSIILRTLSKAKEAVGSIGLTPDEVDLNIKLIPKFLLRKQNPFEDQLFMGMGINSVLISNMLHRRLDDALSWLSGMQQLGHQGETFDTEMFEKGKKEIEMALNDIKTALLGK